MQRKLLLFIVFFLIHIFVYSQQSFSGSLTQNDAALWLENIQKTQNISTDLIQAYQYTAKNQGVNNINYTCFKELSRVHDAINSQATQTYYIVMIYIMMIDVRDEAVVANQLRNQIDMFEKIMNIERNIELPVIRNSCSNGNVIAQINRMLENWDKLSNLFTNLKIKMK